MESKKTFKPNYNTLIQSWHDWQPNGRFIWGIGFLPDGNYQNDSKMVPLVMGSESIESKR